MTDALLTVLRTRLTFGHLVGCASYRIDGDEARRTGEPCSCGYDEAAAVASDVGVAARTERGGAFMSESLEARKQAEYDVEVVLDWPEPKLALLLDQAHKRGWDMAKVRKVLREARWAL